MNTTTDVLMGVVDTMLAEPCRCEEAWTARGRHAPDCRWQAFRDYGLAEARAALVAEHPFREAPALDPARPRVRVATTDRHTVCQWCHECLTCNLEGHAPGCDRDTRAVDPRLVPEG